MAQKTVRESIFLRSFSSVEEALTTLSGLPREGFAEKLQQEKDTLLKQENVKFFLQFEQIFVHFILVNGVRLSMRGLSTEPNSSERKWALENGWEEYT